MQGLLTIKCISNSFSLCGKGVFEFWELRQHMQSITTNSPVGLKLNF